MNPAAFTIFNNIGNCYRRQARHAEALGWYQKALESWPDFAEALNNSGVTLQDMGRLADAVPYFERALAARADYPDPLINLGNNYRDRGRPEQAIGPAQGAAMRPDNPHIWNNLGCCAGDQERRGGTIASASASNWIRKPSCVLQSAVERSLSGSCGRKRYSPCTASMNGGSPGS
jgi:tetratricopeptide (TPR) repeat protein